MSSKVCFKCKKEKPLSEFYKHKQMSDGHLNKCKECAKADVVKNRRQNLSYYQEYDRFRYDNQADRKTDACECAKRALADGRHTEYNRNWRQRNKQAAIAHTAVSNAIRDGRLVRQPCSVCGSTDDIEAHHEDYDRPLDVTWLCPRHHSDFRKKERSKGFIPRRKIK
jgi:hypothetical protein